MITNIIINIDVMCFALMPAWLCPHYVHASGSRSGLGVVLSWHGRASYVGHLSLSILSALESHVLSGLDSNSTAGQLLRWLWRASMNPFESRCCNHSESTLSQSQGSPLWTAAFHTKKKRRGKEDWGCQWMKYWYMVLGGGQGLT